MTRSFVTSYFIIIIHGKSCRKLGQTKPPGGYLSVSFLWCKERSSFYPQLDLLNSPLVISYRYLHKMKEGFHSLELNHATWEVPQKYSNLAGIGSGAYGQVKHKSVWLPKYLLYTSIRLILSGIGTILRITPTYIDFIVWKPKYTTLRIVFTNHQVILKKILRNG